MESLFLWLGGPVVVLTLAWFFSDSHDDASAVPDITAGWVVVTPQEAKSAQVAGPVMRGMIVALMLTSLDGASTAVVEAIVTNVQDEVVDVHVRRLYDALGPASPSVPAVIRNVLKGDLLKAAES